jgi:drug/metabolite transporter (DMT)-like permease
MSLLGLSSSEEEVGLAGDAAALAAAAAMVGYLLVGRRLRAWMPVFVYVAPVTGVAACGLTLAAAASGGVAGALGWLANGRYAAVVAYLAVCPGIVGHAGLNTLLRYMTPLTIGLATQMEPVLGPLISSAAGLSAPPGAATYGGGALVLAATALVLVSSSERERLAAAADGPLRGGAAIDLARVFKDMDGAEADEGASLLGRRDDDEW